MTGIEKQNNTIKKNRDLRPFYHSSKKNLPPSSSFSSGLFLGLDPNDHPNPDLSIAAPPESQIVRFPNCIP